MREIEKEKKRISFLGLAKGVWLVNLSCNIPKISSLSSEIVTGKKIEAVLEFG